MAKNDFKFESFVDFNEWLASAAGQNALRIDSFADTNVAKNHAKEVAIGKQMHNIEKDMREIQEVYARAGFTKLDIKTTRTGTTFTFLTPNNSVKPEDCPSLEISSENGGLLIHNGMVAYNSPVALMNGANKLGFVSEISLAISRAKDKIEENMTKILSQSTIHEKANLIQYYTKKSMHSSTEEIAGLYDLKALQGDMKEYAQKAKLKKRPESVQAQINQLHYMTAFKQMFDKGQKDRSLRYDLSFEKFTAQLEEVMDLARMTKNVDELEKAMKFNRTRYMAALKIWDSQLKNFFEPIIAEFTQGGMTEGTRGRVGLQEPDLPFSKFGNTGKKSTQNTQVFEQKSNFALNETIKDAEKKIKTVAAAKNRLFTQTQKQTLKQYGLSDTEMHKDLYGVAYISEQDIHRVQKLVQDKREELTKKLGTEGYKQLLLETTKGFGNDAAFITEDFVKEMSDIKEERALKDMDVDPINNMIVKRIKKYILNNRRKGQNAKEEAEIQKEIDSEFEKLEKFNFFELTEKDFKGKGKKDYHSYLRKYFRETMRTLYPNLDDKAGTAGGGVLNTGFDYEYDAENRKIVNVKTTRETDRSAQIGRGGATGDARHNQTIISNIFRDLLVEAVFGKDYAYKDKISIFRSNDTGFSNKTIQRDIIEYLNTIINYGNQQKLAEERKNPNSIFGRYLIYDKKTGDYAPNEKALNEDFFAIKQTIDGKKTFKKSATELLIELNKLASKVGVEGYKADDLQIMTEAELKKTLGADYDGGDLIVSKRAQMRLTENPISSTYSWEGLGGQSNTDVHYTWAALSSLEQSRSRMSHWLLKQLDISDPKQKEEYENAMKPLGKVIDTLREKQAEKTEEYQKLIGNVKNISQTFRTDTEKYRKEVVNQSKGAETNVILAAEDLADAIAKGKNIVEYENGKLVFKGKDPSKFLLNIVEDKVKDKFKELKQKYGEDGEAKGENWEAFSQRTGIKSIDDLYHNVFVDLGNDELQGIVDGQELKSRVIALPSMNFKHNKDGSYSTFEGAKRGLDIVSRILDIYNAPSADKARARQNALYGITEAYEAYRDSVVSGSDYKRTHTFDMGSDSGYLKTLALTENASDIIKDLGLHSGAVEGLDDDAKNKILEELGQVNAVITTNDFIAMWHEAAYNTTKEEKEKARAQIDQMFEMVVDSEDRRKIKQNDYNAKIKKIAQAYDISNNEKFSGHTIKGLSWLRNPIINMRDDVNGMTAVLTSSKMFAKGNVYMDPELLAIGHGDADGDLIGMTRSLEVGDMEAFGVFYQRYIAHIKEQQSRIDKADKEGEKKIKQGIAASLNMAESDRLQIGEVAKVDSVQDLENKAMTIGAMFDAKKGAGIFGDMVYFLDNLTRSVKEMNPHSEANGLLGFEAQTMHAIMQSLYQKGINIKNAAKLAESVGGEVKESYTVGEKSSMALAQIESLFQMLNQSATFDDIDRFRTFLQKGETIGAFDLNAMFSDNTLETLGMNDLDDAGLKKLLEIAESHKKKIEASNSRNRELYLSRINKDIELIKKARKEGANVLLNASSELATALVYDFNYGHQIFGDKSLGYNMSHPYQSGLIPKHEGTKGGVALVNQAIDTVKNTAKKGTKQQQAEVEEFLKTDINSILKEIESAEGVSPYAAKATTTAVHDFQVSKGTNPDVINLANKLLNADLEKLTEKEKEDIVNNLTLNPQIKGIAMAVIKGNIAHATSEALDKYGANYFDNKDYLKTKEKNKKVLDYLNKGDVASSDKLIEEATHIGEETFAYINQLIEKDKGEIIGTELSLAGYAGINKSNKLIKERTQKADIIYKNGKDLVVGDLKLYGEDNPGLGPILQVYDYMQSLKILKAELDKLGGLAMGPTDAENFLNMDNKVSEMWQERVRREAEAAGGTDRDYEQARDNFKKLYDAINRGEGVNVKGKIFQTNTKTGVLREYSIKESQVLDRMYAVYLDAMNKKGMTREEALQTALVAADDPNALKVQQDLIVENSRFVGTEDQRLRLVGQQNGDYRQKEFDLATAQEKLKDVQKDIEELTIFEDLGIITEKEKEFLANQKKAEEELKAKIGDADKVSKLESEIKDLDEQIKKAKGDQKKDLRGTRRLKQAELEEIKKTLVYQAKEAGDKLANVSLSDDPELGKDVRDITKAEVHALAESMADKERPEESSENIKHLTTLIDRYKKLAQETFALKQELDNNPLLSEAEKKIGGKQLEIKEKQRAAVEAEITKRQNELYVKNKGKDKGKYVYIDEKGEEISKEEAEYLGSYIDVDEFNKQINDEEKDRVVLEAHNKVVRFEKQAYQILTDKWKRQEEIDELKEKIGEAQEKGNSEEVERLNHQLELSEHAKELYDKLEKTQIQKMKKDGFTEDGYKNIVELTDLEHNMREAARKKNKEQSSSNNGGGLLGINNMSAQWVSRLMNGGLIMSFIRLVRRGFKDLTNMAKQLDQAMTNLRIVTGKNAKDARTLINEYANLGKELGATTVEVTNAAQAWIRQGYEVAQVNDLVKSSLYLSKLGMIDTTEATRSLTSALHGFKLEASEAMDIVDKLTALDVKAATTAGDIAQGLSQFANLASLGGVNIDQAAAYVATIADVNQMSGTTVGQSLKTIISRYGNVKAGAYNQLNLDSENNDTSEKLNDVERVLTKMGISIRNTNLEFKDFDEILDEIAGKWGTLDNVSKRAIANAFAGVRQQESFLILLENYDKYKELLEVSETSEGTAEKKYQSYRESYAASRNEFTASLEQLANSSELSKLLRDLTDMGTKLIKILQEGFKYLPGIIQVFSLYTTATGQGLLTKGYDFLSKNKEGFSPFAGVKTLGKNFKASFGAIRQKLEERKLKKEQEKLNKDKKEAIKAEEKKVELSKQEALNKERTLNAGKEESQMKENTVQSGKQEQVEKNSVAQKAAIESQEKDATVNKGVQEEMNKEQVVQDSKIEAQNKEQVVQSSKEEAANEQGGSAGGAGAGGAKPSKMRVYLAMAEMAATTLMTGLMQLSTAATTHKYNGETVESSEKAQKAGSAWSAAISTIPLIGGAIGPWVGEAIAQSIDEERDRANYATKQANENIGKLSSFSSSLDSIGEEEIGSAERHKLVKEFKEDIFDEDNKEMRELLEKRLGGKNLSTLLSEIDSNTANSEEALRDLKKAQLEALKLQINSKYSSTMFENQEELNRVLADIEDYQGDVGAAVGSAAGIGTVSTIGGAVLAGLGTGAAMGSSATPIGIAIGAIVGAVAGLIVGIIGGSQAYDATIENSKSKYKSATWNSLNTTEKIDYAQEQIDFYRSEEYLEKLKRKASLETTYYLNRMNSSKVIVDSNGNTIDAKEDPEKFIELKTEQYYKKFLNDTNQTIKELQRTIDILESQESIENQIFDEVNEITMRQAMNDAKVEVNGKNKYLNNMSIAELKAMGIDEILLSFATALEANGGLIGKNVWADTGQLSELGYDYLFEQIKKQGDEEINAVLSGESYTLEEVFGLKKGTYQTKKLLKSFADALGITVDELNNNADKLVSMYGKLTYAETIMSTEDLHTNIDNYTSLLSSITSGAGQKSDWMETIISQFPDLLSSTNDTANLYGATITKMKQLALTYRNAQYNDMMSSSDLFDDLKKNFYSKLDTELGKELAAGAKAALEEANVASLSDVMSWIQTQYDPSTEEGLTEQAKNVRDIIIATVEEAGIEVATSQMKAYYDALIDFNTKVIDNEISNLESQKEALQEINSQREYENKLIEAKLKLEDAEKQKKRVYRAGVGWVYESDQSAIKEAQENLDSVSREKTVSQLEERITTLQAQKEELQNIYERQNFEELQKLNEQAKKDGDVMSTIDESISTLASSVDGISKSLSKMMGEEEEKNQGNKETAIAEAEEAWKELNSISPDSENYNTALENFHNKMNEAINNGATRSDFNNWETYGYNYTDDQQAANRSSMQKGLSAWEVANMDIADQQTKTKSYFAVKHPDHAGYLVGNTNGDIVSDGSDMSNTIFDAVKSGSAFIWTDKDTTGRLTNDFIYQASESDESLSEYLQRISESSGAEKPTQILVATTSGDTVLYENGLMWKVVGGTKDKWVHTEDYAGAELFNKSLSEKAKIDTEYNREKMEKVLGYFGLKVSGEYANGTLGVSGNSTNLINELGTEAIITPQGTIAALPSRTGIVPADITKNLWELGDIAPELIRVLGGVVHSDKVGKSIFDNFATDESFNISNLVMNIDADPQFDVDKFINAIKTRVSLTKNNSR